MLFCLGERGKEKGGKRDMIASSRLKERGRARGAFSLTPRRRRRGGFFR